MRSNVEPELFDADQTVRAYKDLSKVERAFRSMKTVDLKVRPIYHRRADRVRAHVLLCMLAYCVERHMRKQLAPVRFDDHDPQAEQRSSVVGPAQRSLAAQKKAASKRTADDLPVHSFRGLMSELATLTVNQMQLAEDRGTFSVPTQPTPVQQRSFELIGSIASDVATHGICHFERNYMNRNYSAGMADVRQGDTIGLPAKTLVNASMTLPPFLRMVEM